MSADEARVHHQFSVQYGLLGRWQLDALGLTAEAVRHRLRSGRWERVAPGVYGIPGHRPSWRRELWRAWLHAGPSATVAFESAARLEGFSQARAGRVELMVPDRRRHAPPGVTWHRSDDLAACDRSEVDGLPVTTAARCAFDLAAVFGPARLRLFVEEGVLEGRFTLAEVGAALARLRRRGKPGVQRLATVLDDLGPGDDLPRSELERLADEVVVASGLPAPVHEHPLPGPGNVTGFVDRCWPDAKLILEADGRRWHGRRQQMVRDNERTLAAQAVGYETCRFMWETLRHDPQGCAELLRAVHAARTSLLAPRPGEPMSHRSP